MLVMLKFYGRGKDPFRSAADHAVPLLPDSYLDGRGASGRVPLPVSLGAQLLDYGVSEEVAKAFDVDRRLAGRVVKRYVDDDGDIVVLDDADAFREAWKVVQRTGGLQVLVDAELKPGAAIDAPIPEMSRPHSLSSATETVSIPAEASEQPPSWFSASMADMKQQLMDEMSGRLQSLSTSFASAASSPESAASGGEPKKAANKSSGSEAKAAKGAGAAVAGFDCTLCCRNVERGHRFVCLECVGGGASSSSCDAAMCRSCGAVLCGDCMAAGGHPAEHVMLCLPQRLGRPPKELLVEAAEVLRSTRRAAKQAAKAAKQSQRRAHQRQRGSRDQLRAALENERAIEAIFGTRQPAAEAADGGELAELSVVIVNESETRVMNQLNSQTAAYWKRWTVENAGTRAWDQDVRLLLESTSGGGSGGGGGDVFPFAPEAIVPRLTPGQRGDLVVWVYGPVAQPGVYRASWQMRHGGAAFGPLFNCEWTIGEHAQAEARSPAEDESIEDDDYSLVSREDETDYELVSNSPTGEARSLLTMDSVADEPQESTPAPSPPPYEAALMGGVLPMGSAETGELLHDCANALSALATPLECVTAASSVAGDAPPPTETLVEDAPVVEETEVKETMMVEPTFTGDEMEAQVEVAAQMRAARGAADAAEPAESLDDSAAAPALTDEEKLTRLLAGVVRTASNAIDNAKQAIQSAGSSVHQQLHARGREQWVPPPTQWQPPTGWVPRATQTPSSTPADADWTPPAGWAPPTDTDAQTAEQAAGNYAAQMELLVNMGFTDIERNELVLAQCGGDLQETIDFLLTCFELVSPQ